MTFDIEQSYFTSDPLFLHSSLTLFINHFQSTALQLHFYRDFNDVGAGVGVEPTTFRLRTLLASEVDHLILSIFFGCRMSPPRKSFFVIRDLHPHDPPPLRSLGQKTPEFCLPNFGQTFSVKNRRFSVSE